MKASGMPLGACVARRSIMNWEKGTHGNTYGGNPVACAAALATMNLVEEQYMNNAAKMGKYALDCLEEIMHRHPSLGNVRGKGLMIGVEFVKDPETREPDVTLRNNLVEQAFKEGLLLLGAGKNSLRLCPPLIIKEEHVDMAMETVESAWKQIKK